VTRLTVRRRALTGLVIMLVGVLVGGTVQSSTPNGQTILAIILVGVGGYLWATDAWMRDDR
jgi:hypothetical protein